MVTPGVKLLLDQNLSAFLLPALEGLFPGSTHVGRLGLDRATDEVIWDHAAREDFVVVSKDTDFYQRSALYGEPPKVIWVAVGNCSTATVRTLLVGTSSELAAFGADLERSFLILD